MFEVERKQPFIAIQRIQFYLLVGKNQQRSAITKRSPLNKSSVFLFLHIFFQQQLPN